jgi:hypothetical protein
MAELLVNKQLKTSALVETAQTPPPAKSVFAEPDNRVAPFLKVNPLNKAPLVNHAQRMAVGPFGTDPSGEP